MRSPERRASESAVALAVAGGLLLLARPDPPPRPAACPEPRAVAGEDPGPVVVACAVDPRAGRPLAGPASLLFGRTLDANRAPAAWLEALPGIGPARATAWVQTRREAPFCGEADLARVAGIGPRTRERLAGLVHVSPSPGCSERVGARAGGSRP